MASKPKIRKVDDDEIDTLELSEEEEEEEPDESGKQRRVKSSAVHDEFTRRDRAKKDGGPRKSAVISKCNHCAKEYIGKNPTTLKEHLFKKHKTVYDQVEQKDAAGRLSQKEKDLEGVAHSSRGLKKASDALLKSGPMDKFLGGRSKSAPPMAKERQKQVEQKLAFWVGSSTLPLNFVEHPAFETFIQGLDIQATAPSAKKLRSLINKMADDVVQRMKLSLANARKVSVTTDIWSSKGCKNSYLGATTHSFNPVTKKKDNYRISCRLFDCKHSGFNIAVMLNKIFTEYGIEHKTNRVHADNASNMIKAVRDLNSLDGEDAGLTDSEDSDSEDSEMDIDESDILSDCDEEPEDMDEDKEEELVTEFADTIELDESIFKEAFTEQKIVKGKCVVHTLQLPICRAIKKKKSAFGRVLRKTRKFVTKYRRSSKAKAVLRKTSYKLTLKGWVKTRWWSDVDMVDTVVKAAESPGKPLEKLADKMGWNTEIGERDVMELKDYLKIMKPFVEVGNRLGAEKLSTMHLVYPMITELLEQMEKNVEDKFYASFCENLGDEVKKYFAFVLDPTSDEYDPLYVTATYLCPVYKGALDEELKKVATDNLKKMIQEETEDVVVEGEDANVDKDKEEETAFELPGFKMLSAKILNSTNNNARGLTDSEKDLKMYESKSQINLEKLKTRASAGKKDENSAELKVQDPLDFWIKEEKSKDYETQLPAVAQDILAIPASSVPSERMYSVAGLLSLGKMGLINPVNLEKRVLIKCNPNLN